MGVVIIGGGHAGVELCDALRKAQYGGPITLVEAQASLPYQRPPLSKEQLGRERLEALPLRHHTFYEANRIQLVRGATVTALDRENRRLTLADGAELSYENMVFAVGAENRGLHFPTRGIAGVFELRTDTDAAAISAGLERAERIVVIGSGFIGLEVAASVRAAGKAVTVISAEERVMSRVVSPLVSSYVEQSHTDSGIDIRLSSGVDRLELSPDGRVEAVITSGGDRIAVDAVVVGVGVIPRTALAVAAGLEVDNGIVVSARLGTSDPRVWAIGDCARFPSRGTLTRFESVQNATDHARTLAQNLVDNPREYTALPWFYSVQGGLRLQIAGTAPESDEWRISGEPSSGKFSVLRFTNGVLGCVESINDGGAHLAARKALTNSEPLRVEDIPDGPFDLKRHLLAARII